ncbi:MAG: hypothetical protein ACNS60_16820 [Candidatus Cyclobacteriaceae bacterium M2_1C_046]
MENVLSTILLLFLTIAIIIIFLVWLKAFKGMDKEGNKKKIYQANKDKTKPYESFDDWLQDVKHLKWALLIVVIIIVMVFILLDL